MIVSLLTDFGTTDAYVAQMKGQILSIAPSVTLVDITHQVPPQNVARGAWLLAQAAPWFPEDSVHLGVVDPGVGTSRALLAVEVWIDRGAAAVRQRFVLPDNGLIDWVLKQAVQWSAHYLTDQRFWGRSLSATFHGRDIMGPIAAHWAAGALLADFGPACTAVQPLNWPAPDFGVNRVRCEVLGQDHFGNLMTNVPANSALPLNQLRWATLKWCHGQCPVAVVRTYGDQTPGQPLLLAGSHGQIEIAVACGDAGQQLGIQPGAKLEIHWEI